MTDETVTHDYVELLKTKEKEEPIAATLKMKLVELKPGYSKTTMTIGPEHLNFNGMIFGGVVMVIADQAFAYASNSLVMPAIASQFNIYLLSGANPGDELTAEGRVLRSGRRIGVTEMTVVNQEGKLIAKATGTTIVTV